MQYVTSVERIGIEKGRQEGRQEGVLTSLLRLLQHRFGAIPETEQQALQKLAVEQIEALFDLALTVPTFPEFMAHLPTPAKTI